VRHARSARVVLAPLFPAYFFVTLDTSRDKWRSINGTRGVSRIVANRERPVPVPLGVVEAIRDRLNIDGTINWSSSLEVGQFVRIADGPFTDLVGTLEHLGPDGRVRVLLELLGRPVSVSLHQESLIPAA
jgi:transcriptional antiterminator RfaH